MIGTSEAITNLHKDKKALITDHLSSLVLEGAGPLSVGFSSDQYTRIFTEAA